MPLNIPNDSKVYTTMYHDFKGVDFTNDSSNVFYRRSPVGKNMLPDVDGRPYKRSGWKVEIPASEFLETVELDSGTVIPDKVFYFELGGKDYLMIFNNLGLFYYTEGELKQITTYTEFDRAGDSHTESFPPTVDGVELEIDAKKAFFFEGGGLAGFYLFAGNMLFIFDGEELNHVLPKIPVVLFACDTEGAGTLLDTVNMLTRERTVQYLCDGTSSTFTVPGGISQIISIEKRRTDTGEWEDIDSMLDWSYEATSTQITIKHDGTPTPPEVVVEGEDNLSVTYIPDDSTATTINEGKTTSWQTISVTQTKTMVKDIYTSGGKTTEKINTTYAYSGTSAEFTLKNPKRSATADYATVQGRNNGWVTMPEGYTKFSYSPYSGKATVKAKSGLYKSNMPTYATPKPTTTTLTKKISSKHRRVTTITKTTKTYRTRLLYDQWVYSSASTETANALTAFFGTTRSIVFGNGIVNQVFLTASTEENYNTRVWYSAATDPSYFPDTNYMEVGATDKPIMGLMRVGEYLGVIKQGSATETSIYLAYPTSFEDDTTYAVKQNVNGIGAISNGAFNILNDEPLFLSAEGVMGIEPHENEERKLRSRSHYINKRLCSEDKLESAISFVYDGMYWLAVNNHCYILDGSQISSWANTKTNLQYECYYLENIPAQCFARHNGQLWFSDFDGNLCRFKDEMDENQFSDEYSITDADITVDSPPTDGKYTINSLVVTETFGYSAESGDWNIDVFDTIYDEGISVDFTETHDVIDSVILYIYLESHVYTAPFEGFSYTSGQITVPPNQASLEYLPARATSDIGEYEIIVTYSNLEIPDVKVGDIIQYGEDFYTVVNLDKTYAYVEKGFGIEAVWGTIADDDGSPHYFKNLQKKGCMVSLLPSSDSGVEVWIQKDSDEPVKIGETDAKDFELPYDFYMKKKIKKYKRLQIICKNGVANDSFGVDKIIKSYTFGNYSKNRGEANGDL